MATQIDVKHPLDGEKTKNDIKHPLEGEKTKNDLSFSQYRAALEHRNHLADFQKNMRVLADAGINTLAPLCNVLNIGEKREDDKTYKVAIVGAGVAGLFTAMLFDHLKEKFKLNVDYEIFEANGPERLGGRLFTKTFSDDLHDYYDVGAMRFPINDVMTRTHKLFEILGMKFNENVQQAQRGDLVQYYMTGKNTRLRYNDITVIEKKPDQKISASNFEITGLPATILNSIPGDVIDESIEKFTDVFQKYGSAKFWRYLMKHGDKYSVRQYLSTAESGPHLNYNAIEWLETFGFGNRWYDQSFSEMVLENLDFKVKSPEDFRCVMGGAQEIARRMAGQLKQKDKIRYNTRVDQLDYIRDEKRNPVSVKVRFQDNDGLSDRTYDLVFNSAPLGAMQHMKLEGINLNWGTKQAIRSLGYGASCKIGMKFREMWWKDAKWGLKIAKGGISKTDLPIRCCVYPSYNIADSGPGVLLVSYTWSAEAEKIGALISRDSPNNEQKLKELVLHDLARLHTTDDAGYNSLLKDLNELYVTHYAHNWFNDPHQVGAFAYFGPDQYSHMYKHIVSNDGKHIIIGEAASAHHAWIVGALESAVRGVYQFCYRHSGKNKPCHDIAEAYLHSPEKLPAPFGPLPAEYDRTEDCRLMDEDAMKKANCDTKTILERLDKENKGIRQADYSPNGDFARQSVLMETIRQRQGGDQLRPEAVEAGDIEPILVAVAQITSVLKQVPVPVPVA